MKVHSTSAKAASTSRVTRLLVHDVLGKVEQREDQARWNARGAQ